MLISIVALLVAAAVPAAAQAAPALSIEPDHYDFGVQSLQEGSNSTGFQFRNDGTESLQITWVELVGSGSNAFSLPYSTCFMGPISPGGSCSIFVSFNPQDAIEYTAQLKVDVGSDSFFVDLSGTGGRATFAPDSDPVDFGAAKVGSAGNLREIEVTNVGNMPGGFFIALIGGGAIGSFQIVDETCTGIEIGPADTCTLLVRFQPTSEGTKKATLGLFSNSEGPTPIVLTGVGTAPDQAATAETGPSSQAGSAAAGPRPKGGKRKPRSQRRNRRGRVAVQSARLVLAAR